MGGKGADPFLRDIVCDVVKSYWLCLFILRRYFFHFFYFPDIYAMVFLSSRCEGVRGYKSDCGHQTHVPVWRARISLSRRRRGSERTDKCGKTSMSLVSGRAKIFEVGEKEFSEATGKIRHDDDDEG